MGCFIFSNTFLQAFRYVKGNNLMYETGPAGASILGLNIVDICKPPAYDLQVMLN